MPELSSGGGEEAPAKRHWWRGKAFASTVDVLA